jgi:hypothetical protein
MSNYQIRFDPRLEIDPADFVAAWNNSPDCQTVAKAELNSSATNYDLGSALVLLSGIAIGIAANTIYDLLKQTVINHKAVQKLLEKRSQSKQMDSIDVQIIEQPDGSQMLVVVIREH